VLSADGPDTLKTITTSFAVGGVVVIVFSVDPSRD